MSRTIIIPLGLLVLILGGVYLIQRNAPKTEVVTTATSTDTTATSPASGRGGLVTIPEVGEVTLGLGETAAFRGLMITPKEVVEDSRCPAGVYCIQAGTLALKIYISSDLGTSTMTVKLGGSITTEAHKITLVSVDPLKTAKSDIAAKDYRFTIKVEKQ